MAEDNGAIPVGVAVVYPNTLGDQARLRELLDVMGLRDLYLIPWDIETRSYLDFYNRPGGVSDRFVDTIRGQSSLWDMQFVADAFRVPFEGSGMVSQKKKLPKRYFVGDRVDSHGYKPSQCVNPELLMLLRFLVPIF
jgi:hypothetical protein